MTPAGVCASTSTYNACVCVCVCVCVRTRMLFVIDKHWY